MIDHLCCYRSGLTTPCKCSQDALRRSLFQDLLNAIRAKSNDEAYRLERAQAINNAVSWLKYAIDNEENLNIFRAYLDSHRQEILELITAVSEHPILDYLTAFGGGYFAKAVWNLLHGIEQRPLNPVTTRKLLEIILDV